MKSQNLNGKKHLEVQRVKCCFKGFLWNKDEVLGTCKHARLLGNYTS